MTHGTETVGRSIVSADALARLLADESSHIVVLEVLDGTGDPGPVTGRIPGAVPVSFADDLRGAPTGANGNAPLPDPAVLEDRLRAWGIDAHSTVVVYTRGRPASASRAWFVLRWAGLPDVRYLDGGWRAWQAAGGAESTQWTMPTAGSATVRPGSVATLTADDAHALATIGTLLDARGSGPYRGDPGQPHTTGHIPGAINAPNADLRDVNGLLLDEAQLRDYFEDRGVDGERPVGIYCGAGVGATYELLALESIGIRAAVYVGSWSEWIADPDRPVAQSA